MSNTEILSVLTHIFREHFGDESLVLKETTTARDVPGWDSASMVMLILAAEEHYGIHFRGREIDSLRCVGDWTKLIDAHIADSRDRTYKTE